MQRVPTMGEVRRRLSGTRGTETASLGPGDNPESDLSKVSAPAGDGSVVTMYNILQKKEGENDKVNLHGRKEGRWHSADER